MKFDYEMPAELFMTKRKSAALQRLGYRRFATAAEAIRFAVEEFPAIHTLGAYMQVGDDRFDSDDIHRLYESAATIRCLVLHDIGTRWKPGGCAQVYGCRLTEMRMALRSINDPKHWRERAEEARALANQMNDKEAHQLMLGTCDGWTIGRRSWICFSRSRSRTAPSR
jgi:hypothetical protein